MTDRSEALAYFLLKQELEDFFYHEAELLDERRYEDWLELLADDVRYWMPMHRNVKFGELEREFTREGLDINWFDEGKETLTRRVQQILTWVHWAEEPLSRICHMVSNIQLLHVRPSVVEPAAAIATITSAIGRWTWWALAPAAPDGCLLVTQRKPDSLGVPALTRGVRVLPAVR